MSHEYTKMKHKQRKLEKKEKGKEKKARKMWFKTAVSLLRGKSNPPHNMGELGIDPNEHCGQF